METKLKTMTEAEIFAKETALRDALAAVCEEYTPKFEASGYSLSSEIARCSEETEYAEDALEAPGAYRSGYNCRATVFVKRPKTEEELSADETTARDMSEAMAEEADSTCSLEEMENEGEVDVKNKTVAFTQLIFSRVYRVFWVDKIVLADSVESIRADLDEFLAKIAEKAGTEASTVD